MPWSRPSGATHERATAAWSTTSRAFLPSAEAPLRLDQPLGDLGRGRGAGLPREREAAVELERLAVQRRRRVAREPPHQLGQLLERGQVPARRVLARDALGVAREAPRERPDCD